MFLLKGYKLVYKKMYNVFALLVFISLLILVSGLIFPRIFVPILKTQPSRKKIAAFFSLSVVVNFVLFGLTVPSKNKEQSAIPITITPASQLIISPTSLPSPTTVSPTESVSPTILPTSLVTKSDVPSPNPTSTNWIENPLCDNTKEYTSLDSCLRDKYPLNAKVKKDALALYITNPEKVSWTSCRVWLDDGSYGMNLFDSFDISAGSTTRVTWGRLTDDNGNRFNYYKTQPEQIDISCAVNHERHQSQYGDF